MGEPAGSDAKVGRAKDGATHMLYKPEAVVDLDTGAIMQAEVHPGDHSDHKEPATRIFEAQQTISEAREEEPGTLSVESVTSDKGYYPLEICRLFRGRASAP